MLCCCQGGWCPQLPCCVVGIVNGVRYSQWCIVVTVDGVRYRQVFVVRVRLSVLTTARTRRPWPRLLRERTAE